MVKEQTDNAGEQFFFDDAGIGFEDVQASDITLPRLTILQKLSPQLSRDNPEFIKSAVEGEICDTGTGETFEKVQFIPVIYRKAFVEWEPRGGKGIVGIYDKNSCPKPTGTDDRNQPMVGDNSLIDTAYFFGFRIKEEGGEPSPAYISFQRTQHRAARRWLAIAMGLRVKHKTLGTYNPPLWYKVYDLSTFTESNSQGRWYGWTIEPSEETLASWALREGLGVEKTIQGIKTFRRSFNFKQLQIPSREAPSLPGRDDDDEVL